VSQAAISRRPATYPFDEPSQRAVTETIRAAAVQFRRHLSGEGS